MHLANPRTVFVTFLANKPAYGIDDRSQRLLGATVCVSLLNPSCLPVTAAPSSAPPSTGVATALEFIPILLHLKLQGPAQFQFPGITTLQYPAPS